MAGRIGIVEPIRDIEDINKIKELLLHRKRKQHYCLFIIGINTNLRPVDISRITVDMVRNLMPGDDLVIKEKKTGKLRRITLNRICYEAIQMVLKEYGKACGDYPLIRSNKRGKNGEPLALQTKSICKLVKSWCKKIGLEGNYGAYTLRKTWGYHQRKTFGVDIPTLMVCFNHSSQEQTLRYLGIQPDEVKKVYLNEL